MIHTVKGFSVVNEAEVDVFLEFSYFFCDPTDVGNLISGSSPFLNPCEIHPEYWVNHKLESRLPGGISIDMQMIPL